MSLVRLFAILLVGIVTTGGLVPLGSHLVPDRVSPASPEIPGSSFLPTVSLQSSATGNVPIPSGVPASGRGLFPPLVESITPAGPVPSTTLPTSDVFETPLPSVPSTTPTVLNLAANITTCCVYANFPAPSGGPWAAIVLNYTGQAVGGVFDSSYRAYVDGAQVLFGTTPEYGQWVVLKDVTEYSSLFAGTVNVTFLLSAALNGGHFVSSVRVLFYPVAAGTRAPTEPNMVVPLWNKTYVRSTTPSLNRSISVPTNVSNATLELYVYGFGPDEFWYLNNPGFRTANIAVDGRTIVSVLPFPYVNTGGIDLFLWRPITADFTLSDRPYDFDLGGALGLVEGAHNFTASVPQLLGTSAWLIQGNLLLYTNTSVAPAKSTAYRYAAPTPTISTDGRTYYDENASVSYSYSSTVALPAGVVNATDTASNSYGAAFALSSNWENMTGTESMATSSTFIGTTSSNFTRTYRFPFGMDLGSYFVESSSTNGSYPIYGNVTAYTLGLHQTWNETLNGAVPGAGGASLPTFFHVADTLGASGELVAAEKLISATAAELLAITLILAETTKLYSSSATTPAGTSSWTHLLVGSAYQPPAPYNAETLSVNQVIAPITTAVSVSAAAIDAGQLTVFSVRVQGGYPPYQFLWSGLPQGCAPSNTAILACSPANAGSYAVSATVKDSLGFAVTTSAVTLSVAAALSVRVTSSPSATDVNGTVSYVVQVSGGTPPYSCVWIVNGALARGSGDCSLPYSGPVGFAAGTRLTQVTVTDGLGGTAHATTTTIVNPALSVRFAMLPVVSSIIAGSELNFTISVLGGTLPYTVVWYENGGIVPGENGSILVFVPTRSGTYYFAPVVSDAAGTSVSSSPLVVNVTNRPGPAGGGSALSQTESYEYLGGGVGLGAVAAFIVAWAAYHPVRKPPAKGKSVRSPIAPGRGARTAAPPLVPKN